MSNRESGRTSAPSRARGPAARTAVAEGEPRPRFPRGARAGEGSRAVAFIEVDSSEPAEHLFRRLLSAYLRGETEFEVVEVPQLSSGTREVVREFCRRTRSPELEGDDGQHLRVVDPEPIEEGIDRRLQDLGAQVLRFHREAVESWSDLPLGAEGRWADRDDEIDRQAWYLERCIARGERRGARPTAPATSAWTIARSLERIGDHAVALGEIGPRLAEFGPEASPVRELRQFHQQAMAHLEEVLRATDGRGANELLDVGEALAASGRALTDRLLPAVGDGSMTPATAAALARALEAISRTVAYSQDIAQAFFDRALQFPHGTGLESSPVPIPG
jgi:PhoU domain